MYFTQNSKRGNYATQKALWLCKNLTNQVTCCFSIKKLCLCTSTDNTIGQLVCRIPTLNQLVYEITGRKIT